MKPRAIMRSNLFTFLGLYVALACSCCALLPLSAYGFSGIATAAATTTTTRTTTTKTTIVNTKWKNNNSWLSSSCEKIRRCPGLPISSCSSRCNQYSSNDFNGSLFFATTTIGCHHHHQQHIPALNTFRLAAAADSQRNEDNDNNDHEKNNVVRKQDDDNNNNKVEKKDSSLSFVFPSLSQILALWIVAVSLNRILESFPNLPSSNGNSSSSDDITIVLNIVLNSIIFLGSSIFLLKTIQGIDYDTLEGLDQKSLAKQSGKWALEGTIPEKFVVVSNDEMNPTTTTIYEVATFAGGCFWGTELYFQRIPGVIATCVGYTQGFVKKPNYEQVCSGRTGHTEALQLIFDPTVCSYERLLTQLFDTINPTLLNRVGNDSGTQYRHGVYTHTKQQAMIAATFFESIQSKYHPDTPIVTELKPADIFWPAENYHQRYLEKRGQSAEKNCEEKVRCYG